MISAHGPAVGEVQEPRDHLFSAILFDHRPYISVQKPGWTYVTKTPRLVFDANDRRLIESFEFGEIHHLSHSFDLKESFLYVLRKGVGRGDEAARL